MKIIEKQVEFPGRKRIKKVSEESNGDIIVDITKAEGTVTVEGTQVNASTLEKINWRDDDSVSFASMQGDVLPEALAEKVQIVTKSNGETWLIPPLNLGQSVQLGKITGTTLKNENNIEMANAQIGTDFPSNAHISAIEQAMNATNGNFNSHLTDNDKHVTSSDRNVWNAKQNAITGGATSITNSNLNPDKVLLSDANGKVSASTMSSSELLQNKEVLSGITTNVQQQLNEKANADASNVVSSMTNSWTEKICSGNIGFGDRITRCELLESGGFIKYASGLTVQWGRVVSTTNKSLTMQIYFAANIFTQKPTVLASRGKPYSSNWKPSGYPVAVNQIETGSFYLENNDNSNPMQYCWIAIGK